MKYIVISATSAALLIVAVFLTSIGRASPAQVILIRHAEKPLEGNELNERGKQRAAAFVNYFKNNPAVNRHGPLVAIYAMGQHGEDGSLRPIQTVTPLATSLGLSIITRFMKKDVYALARDILAGGSYADKTVLICWEHKMIPEIVKALGYAEPPPFPNVYDRTWLLTFKNGKPLSLQILPQALLPGDDGI